MRLGPLGPPDWALGPCSLATGRHTVSVVKSHRTTLKEDSS